MKKHLSVKSVFFVIVALCSAYPLVMLSCSKVQHFELSRFISPDTCGGCHDEVHGQWKNSMHNLSQVDAIYRAAAFHYLKGLTDADEIAEAESCVKCHTPIGFFSGFPKTVSQERDNPEKVPEIAKEGIQCDFCHSVTGAYAIYNNQVKLDPGHGEADPGTKRGPFKDSKSDYHKSEYSAFHGSSEMCGVCHDVRHVVFGTKLETTFEEWQKSAYNAPDAKKRVNCQNCHMYQRPGVPATGSTPRPQNPGTAAQGGPRRDHIYTHYFVGANMAIPGSRNDAVREEMAVERLKHAAELSIDDAKIKEGKISVTVKNTGAGHNLPTGLTDVRQMWLEVVVRDAAGRTVFSTGVADANGYLPKGSIVYNTVFGDGKGNAVDNIAKARQILRDRRVPPLGSLEEVIALPATGAKTLEVRARLRYMGAPQELIDTLAGKGKISIPAVTMAEAKKTITM
ncbi:MAG TPA: multiheme c-type cytochrome [Spirochaetota bacterium]|nr:multiheme c-type cytochrome [Spirochaetota bacterium]